MAVFCGQCGNEYASEKTELNHVCKVTGVKPTEPESMGANWDKIAINALNRGKNDTTNERLEAAKKLVQDKRAARSSK